MKPLFLSLTAILFACLLITSCKKDGPVSSDKLIDSLRLLKADSTAFKPEELIVTVTAGDSILINVPPFTDVTHLMPVITITGLAISPASGVTQDFSSPVTYTVSAQDGSQKHYTVVVNVRGVVYFGSSDDNFYAVDAVRGGLLWKTAGGDFSYSSPTLANGIIYAGNTDHKMYALDAVTGVEKWSYITESTIGSAPTEANGVVYFGNDQYHFFALDANTGQLKWDFFAGGNISTKPVVLNGTVYFGSDDTFVYALDAASGNLIWKYATGGPMNNSSPAIANGTLYIGNRDGNLYALDLAVGTLKWKFFADNISLEQSSPTVADGMVYIGGWYNFLDFTQPGSLYAVDAETGDLKWKKLDNIGIGSNPVVADGLLYITCDDNYLYAVNVNTHAVAWSSQILANGASPVVKEGIVYCGAGGVRSFYALNAKTGAIKWTFPVGEKALMTSTPIVTGKTSL
jgi:outer membrane protein assembly factor BamB